MEEIRRLCYKYFEKCDSESELNDMYDKIRDQLVCVMSDRAEELGINLDTMQGKMKMMNEIKKAIETIKYLNFCGLCTVGICKECDRKKAKELALSALEKQIPKKVANIDSMYVFELKEDRLHGKCPVCGNYVLDTGKRCICCGQSLDWEK